MLMQTLVPHVNGLKIWFIPTYHPSIVIWLTYHISVYNREIQHLTLTICQVRNGLQQRSVDSKPLPRVHSRFFQNRSIRRNHMYAIRRKRGIRPRHRLVFHGQQLEWINRNVRHRTLFGFGSCAHPFQSKRRFFQIFPNHGIFQPDHRHCQALFDWFRPETGNCYTLVSLVTRHYYTFRVCSSCFYPLFALRILSRCGHWS